ncbi:MAG TPA: Wzz/FepE/Etk N-terminal domain-containing protein [Acidobacteriaceae bacterium]
MASDGNATIKYAEAIFRNKWFVLGIAGSVFLAAVLYAVLAKRQYASTMQILVQNTRPVPVISGDRTPPMAGGGGADAMEAQINSEVVLLQSADLMEGLVRYRDQALAHVAPPEEGSLRMSHELSAVQGRMEVTPLRKSNLIEVQFRDGDAAAAQKTLVWLSTAFLEKHEQLRRPAGTFAFFNRQTKEYQAQLRQAEANLVAFEQANNLVSLEQEKTLTLDNYNRVALAVGESRAGLEDSQKRMSSLGSQLGGVNNRITTQVRDTPNQVSAEQLNTSLVDLYNKRTQLAARFQDNDPLVREMDQQIRTTETALAAARARSSVETVSDNNPIHLSLDQALRTTSADVSGTRARLAALEQQAKGYKGRLDALQKISVQNDVLEREVQEAKQNYEAYAQKRDEASIDDQLDRSKIADISIAQEPTISMQPVQPHRLMTILLGALAAWFAAMAAVLVREAMRETVFTAGELEAMLSVPVLATIPEEPGLPGGAGPADGRVVRVKPSALQAARQA